LVNLTIDPSGTSRGLAESLCLIDYDSAPAISPPLAAQVVPAPVSA
jgi:hypothetical protein